MAEIVTMPKLGFDMAEGTLVRWVIKEGEKVTKGAVLAEIETDKATVEVESSYDGIVARHLVSEGNIVPINTPIAVVAKEGEVVPEDMKGIGVQEKEEIAPRLPITSPTQALSGSAEEEVIPMLTGRIIASPLARRMAQEVGIDLRVVRGTGPEGRITKKDILAYIAAPAITPPPTRAGLPISPARKPGEKAREAAPIPTVMPFAGEEAIPSRSVPLARLRAAIGRRMTEAKQQVPHFYVTHEYDLDALMALRQQVNALLPEEEKISVNDFIIKAAALTLRQFPNLNASLQGNEVLQHGAINIGVAVAVEGGLLTVVCRDTDRKPLRQIANEVRTMVGRAREGKVRPDDIEGSTFSVSNLGMFEVESFIAIINPPEAAILAVGSARQMPVVKNGEIKPGMQMKATISVDHRVSDGVEAAQYMQALARYIEEPLSLLV
jgi:pyruvate dehydrogenase E2 component (dihydrolipoamide acetyltransferase)